MWQDTVIATCQALFIVAMVPTIRSKDKPPLATNVMNVILVSIITVCLATLHLWFSVLTATGVALCWLIVAIQKFSQKNAKA